MSISQRKCLLGILLVEIGLRSSLDSLFFVLIDTTQAVRLKQILLKALEDKRRGLGLLQVETEKLFCQFIISAYYFATNA